MTTKIDASTAGAGGLITTADNSGVLELQSAGVTKATINSTGFNTPSVTNAGTLALTATGANIVTVNTNGSERMRVDSSGNVGVGTSPSYRFEVAGTTFSAGSITARISDAVRECITVYSYSDTTLYNGAACTLGVRQTSGTGRSINASGSINANGADYAEYMTKAGDFVIEKGDVCGIDANGKLTNVFADAITFVVKSTNPSYVGGDNWSIGLIRPEEVAFDASEDEKQKYQAEKEAFDLALENARQKVDRIAFCGQVPVNVFGATSGQYIVPINENGAIKGVAVSNPTFEEYKNAVGKVITIQPDGKALIIVKVS